jgi:hypothetical protein
VSEVADGRDEWLVKWLMAVLDAFLNRYKDPNQNIPRTSTF